VAPIKIYTTQTCGFCVRAKEFFRSRGLTYEEVDVTGDDAARKELVEKTGLRTVPQIWIGPQHVGGYTDLVALDQKGGLEPLLKG